MHHVVAGRPRRRDATPIGAWRAGTGGAAAGGASGRGVGGVRRPSGGVARTAPLQYLMPVVAGVVAWWATGERFSAFKLGGATLTLAGVALAQFADRLRLRP